MPNLPKIQTKFEVFNEANAKKARINLSGVIRKACWWEDATKSEFISAQQVINALNQLDGKDVDIHINSRGGDVFESVAICNHLKEYKGVVTFYVMSLAGSGASVILTGGDKVLMYTNTLQMIHPASSQCWGNAKEMRKSADALDKIDIAVFNSYKKRFVGTEDELKRLIANESFLTAEECLAYGFCDEIIEEKPKKEANTEAQAQANFRNELFAKYGGRIQNSTPHIGSTPEPQEEHPQPQNGLFANFKF